MSFPNGDIPLISNFQLNVAKPLDAKYQVQTHTNLYDIIYPYDGLISYVIDDEKHYFYNQTLGDWFEIGQGVEIDDLNSSLTTTYSSEKIETLISSISGADGNIQTYMLSSSNQSAGTNFMISIDEFVASTITTNTINVSTTPTKLFSFITESGFPNISLIPYGQILLTFETEKASGSAEYYTYAQIYKVNVSNVKTLISTTANSTSVTVNTNIIQNVGAFINTPITLDVTDRLQVDIFAVVSSSNADITLKYDDNTNARFVIPTVQITKTYVDSQLATKQDLLNGTGFVKASGTSISYDNSTYITENEEITINGEASGTGNTAITLTLDNNAVISKLLDIDLNLVGDLNVDDTINDAISKLNNKLFELNVVDFQLLGVFEKNATYKLTDADVNLYGGTEIYLTTNHEGILDEFGLGKFYTPFYQTYNIYNEGTSYAINQVLIWGGSTWLKTSASNSNPTDIFTLSNFWTKEPNSVNNINIDKIKYDYLNDLIIYREDNKGNKVSFDKLYLDNLTLNPIKHFQWGSSKITGQILNNSINENINFSGAYQRNINMLNSGMFNTTLKTNCYQENLILINSFQENLIIRDGGSQENLYLKNSTQNNFEIHNGSSQQNINLIDSNQLNFEIYNSGYQSNINLTNSIQGYFTIQTCTQDNIYMFGSSQTDFILSFVDQLYVYFNNYNRANPTILTLEENLEFKGDLANVTTITGSDKIYVKEDNQVKEISLTNLTTLINSGISGNTNLSYTVSGSNGIVLSDTGTDAIIPLGTSLNAGLLAPSQFDKLASLSGTNSGDELNFYANVIDFPSVGELEQLYIATATNLIYRWSGITYVSVGGSGGGGSTISLTTTGNNGVATLISDVLNIPNYSVSGTSNRISVTSNQIDISSAYVGQSSITTLGTISTGIWNGSSISDTYISSATNWNTAYSNRITSLTTTGNSGSSTLISNVLNIPTYTLAGLGGQTQLNGSGWVKASGTTISYSNNLIFETTTSLPAGNGFYSPAANVVGVVINGIEVARWDSANYSVVSTIAVSGNIFDLTINSTVATGNANINFNSNIANALNFKDASSNDYLRFCTTTNNFKVQTLQQLEVTKSLKQSMLTITSDIILDLNHRIIYVDATSNNVTITLPNPTITVYTNIEYEIKRIDNSIFTVTVQTNVGTVFIDGTVSNNMTLTSLQSKTFRNRTATQWQTF